MFESDGWLDWEPDPERAAREADPCLEPYASMTRPEILALMAEAKGGREWEFLQEYFLNTCRPEELAVGADEFMQTQYAGVFGFEELCYLEIAIEPAIRRRLLSGARGEPAGGADADDARYPFPYPDRMATVNPVPVRDQAG